MQKMLQANFLRTGWLALRRPVALGLALPLLAGLTAGAHPGLRRQPLADTDVLVTTASGPARAGVGQVVTLIATTQNVSATDATGVVVTLQLPAGLSNVAVTSGSYNSSSGLVTFNSATVPAGTTVANSVSFIARSTGTYAAKAASTVSNLTDAVPANNNGMAANANLSTTVTTQQCSTVAGSVAKDGSPTNLGANGPAGGLVVNTYFPSGTTSQTLAAGATSIAVGTPAGTTTAGVSAGDLLLIIQMQGADIDASNTNSYGDGLAGDPASGYLLNNNFVAGTYEYAVATSSLAAGAAGTITLSGGGPGGGLVNSYSNAAATTTAGPRTFQVVRVPQYGNLTLGGPIGAAQWDGTKGGVLAMEVAGKLTFAGFAISAAERGFRGGRGRYLTTAPTTADFVVASSTTAYGQKGESFAGTPQYMRYYDASGTTVIVDNTSEAYPVGAAGRGAPANGGGGTSFLKGGGGGGGNATIGGRGGYNFNGTTTAPTVDERAFGGAYVAQLSNNRLIMGGGGGAGNLSDNVSVNNLSTDQVSAFAGGAQGGGIIIIRAGSVAGSGTVNASGRNSGSISISSNGSNNSSLIESTGGGGAGGGILVTLRDPSGLANLTALATGGKGGDNINTVGSTSTNGGAAGPAGPGGGGAGGVVIANGTFGTVTNTGGRAGYSQYNSTIGTNVNWGATAGTAGVTATLPVTGTNGVASAPASGGAPGTSASADCEDAPTAANDQYATAPNTAITLSGASGTPTAGVLTNDSDTQGGLDATTVDLDPNTPGIQQGSATSPITVTGGTAYVNSAGQITFTPANNFLGTALFPYTVNVKEELEILK